MTVTSSSLSVAEPSGTATFTMKLNTAPTGDVSVPLTAGSGCTLSVTSPLIIAAADWNTGASVTVTAQNDDIDNTGDQRTCTVTTGDPTSSDGDYDTLGAGDVADVTVTVTDDDTAGFMVSGISGNTSETGGQATFTVRLTSEPTANVTIGVSSDTPTEGTVSDTTLTFTDASWNTPQTVTGTDDAVQDGSQSYSIVLGAATSSDAKYNGKDPSDVSVSNTDDEVPPNVACTDITLSSTSVDENSGRAVVGLLSTTDNNAGDKFTYTVTAGKDLFCVSGNALMTWNKLDFEAATSHAVRIRTSDGNGGTFEKDFTISVNDLEDAPIVAENVTITLPADAAVSLTGDGVPVSEMSGDVPVESSTQPEGIVVSYADNSNGNWEYTMDGGEIWISLSTVTGAAADITETARFLENDPENLIRFVPNAGFAGPSEIRFHLWNGEGWYRDGIMADVTVRGESGDISREFVTAVVFVEPDADWVGELSVTVTDAAGLPVANAAVSLSSETGPCLRNGVSDASGGFFSEMLPLADDYRVSVSGPDGSGLGHAEVSDISVSGHAAAEEITLPDADDETCELCGDDPVSPAEAVLPGAGPDEITGRVADVMGTLPPGNMFVSVRVFEKDGLFLKRVTAKADGTFRVTGLDAEKEYQLLVRVIGSNLPLQWVRHVEGFGCSFGIGRERELAGAYSPGAGVSIMLNGEWLG